MGATSNSIVLTLIALCLAAALIHLNNEIIQVRTTTKQAESVVLELAQLRDVLEKYFLNQGLSQNRETKADEQAASDKTKEVKQSPGPPGPPRPQGPAGSSGGGVVFTRWGRTTCPKGAALVYDGLATGSHFDHHGGSADVLCLVRNPKCNQETTSVNSNRGGILYGSEYNIIGGQAFNYAQRHNQNVPCSVCHVSSRSSQLMVPGTNECPFGWTREYTGWLMGGHHGHKGRNMFTCIDKYAEVVPGQQADTDGNLFFHMQADCGTGIPCPPYNGDKELSCVVCTK